MRRSRNAAKVVEETPEGFKSSKAEVVVTLDDYATILVKNVKGEGVAMVTLVPNDAWQPEFYKIALMFRRDELAQIDSQRYDEVVITPRKG